MIFFITIPRCYKDFYFNSFFPCTDTLWNFLSAECFSVTYGLNEFKSRVNRIDIFYLQVFPKQFCYIFFIFFFLFFLLIQCLLLAVPPSIKCIPTKNNITKTVIFKSTKIIATFLATGRNEYCNFLDKIFLRDYKEHKVLKISFSDKIVVCNPSQFCHEINIWNWTFFV